MRTHIVRLAAAAAAVVAAAVPLLIAVTLLVVGTADVGTAGPAPVGARGRGVGSDPTLGHATSATSSTGSLLVPNTRYRVVDHNIEYRDAALRLAIGEGVGKHAKAITLQEVCFDQMQQVRHSHPTWSVAWRPEFTTDQCPAPDDGLLGPGANQAIGDVAIWTGGHGGHASAYSWKAQFKRGQHRGMACVTYKRGATTHVCSVHLSHGDRSQQPLRFRQTQQLRAITHRWTARNDLVVVGGDFNTRQDTRVLDLIYAFRGRGDFREASALPHALAPCRCNTPTFDNGHTKIDYVFYSANRMAPDADRRLRLFPSPSDHDLLSAYADVSTRPTTHQ